MDQQKKDIESRIKIVQFHPSYGYEEFIEGLRPIAGPNGNIEFKVIEGTVLQLADEITNDGKPRVLIIDEMNRANLPRVFGELMYLLEYRSESISLMLRKSFSLPSNLFIIGTMNTADKSIKNIDAAMRRRFDFFTVDPELEILRQHYRANAENLLGENLFEGFKQLNNAIEYDMGESGYAIGHSYFMHDKLDEQELLRIWSRQIYPLLCDYFADRIEVLRDYSLTRFWKID